MFEEMLPEYVNLVSAEPWMWATPLVDAEETLVVRAVEKRKREFRAGRHCAKRALEKSGIHNFPLLKAASREPLWPNDRVGSITHSGDQCAAAVAKKEDCRSIGIDVESASPLGEEQEKYICTKKELAIYKAQNVHNVDLPKLCFSAKECIHKVYYPLNQHMLDFLDAEVEFNIPQQTFTATIIKPEANPRHQITKLNGVYRVNELYVFTAIVLTERELC